jgi:hypothetical protein
MKSDTNYTVFVKKTRSRRKAYRTGAGNRMTLDESKEIEKRIAGRRIVSLYRTIPGVYDAQQDYSGAIECFFFFPRKDDHQNQRIDFIAVFVNGRLVGIVEHLDQTDFFYDSDTNPAFDVLTLKNRPTQIEYRICIQKPEKNEPLPVPAGKQEICCD